MASKRVERRLAAILVADMVGYSRLMEADEAGTINRQKTLRAALIDPKLDEHGGRIVKTTGDGLLVEFASAVDAVTCAVELQRALAEAQAEVADAQRMDYRIGVNLGDIVIEDGDILGDGVNIAARLEALAEPGGICVSDVVRQSVAGKVDVTFDPLGARKLKNIVKPVQVHAVRVGDRASAARAASTAITAGKPCIAVMPFDNMSGDADQAYFADGVTEDLITALSKNRWLLVVARNSTFVYKGKSADVRRVAADLGAGFVVEGSVRKAGNRVRISAQLIDAASGNHIWAERYDRDLEDIFAVQDEISATIAARIEPELGAAERQRVRHKPPRSLTAWDS